MIVIAPSLSINWDRCFSTGVVSIGSRSLASEVDRIGCTSGRHGGDLESRNGIGLASGGVDFFI